MRGRPYGIFLLAMLAGAGCSTPLRQVRLQVDDRGPAGCVDTAELRASVSEQLGYDPWSAGADESILVHLEKEVAELRATMRLRGADGMVAGKRTLAAAPHECADLARALAFAISLAIDPIRASQPAKKMPAAAEWVVSAHGGLQHGTVPSWAGELQLGGAWRRGMLQLGGDLLLNPRSSARNTPGGRVDVLRTGLLATACYGPTHLHGCVLAETSALRGSAEQLMAAHPGWMPRVGAGVRLASELRLSATWRLSLRLESLGAVVRPILTDDLDTVELWSSPMWAQSVLVGLSKQL